MSMDLKSTISAVIPCFNRAQLICHAIESTINQTIPVKEIIVVDDGSTDDSVLSIEHYIQRNGGVPIRLVRLIQNQGVSAARNAGIAVATGRWVAFLDSDDRWLPNHNATLLATAEKYPNVHMVFGDCLFIKTGVTDTESWAVTGGTSFSRPKIAEYFAPFMSDGGGMVDRSMFMLNARSSVIPTSGCMVDRATLLEAGCFKVGQHYGEDRLCWITMMSRYAAAFSLTPVSQYFYHSENSTRKKRWIKVAPYLVSINNDLIKNSEKFYLSDIEVAMIQSENKNLLRDVAFHTSRSGIKEMLRHKEFLYNNGLAFSVKDWFRGSLMSLRSIALNRS